MVKAGAVAAPLQVMESQSAFVLTVTVLLTVVKPELPSKITSSFSDGTMDCKVLPPLVVAQWLISLQLPEPPIQ